MSPDPSQARSSPAQSVTTPPASRTSSAPAATSHGAEPLLEVAVEHPGRGPREVEARRAGAPQVLERPQRALEHREVLVEPVALGPEREPGRADRLLGRAVARPDRLAVAVRAPAAPRRSTSSPSSGACTTPTTGSPSATSADRHADHREAVQEVGGAVERVDEPADVARARPALLAEERDVGRGIGEHLADRALARRVDVAHPVARALRRGRCARPPKRRRARRAPPASPRRGAASSRRRGRGQRRLTQRPRCRRVRRAARRCRRRRAGGARRGRRRRARGPSTSTIDAPASVAHEQPAEVVPRRVLIGPAVDVAVERAGGDVAQRERCRAQRPELPPRQRPAGQPGDARRPRRSTRSSATARAARRRAHAPLPRTAV